MGFVSQLLIDVLCRMVTVDVLVGLFSVDTISKPDETVIIDEY